MELKWKKNLTEKGLVPGLAVTALNQINEMRYDAEMREYGIQKRHAEIWRLLFLGKRVQVETI